MLPKKKKKKKPLVLVKTNNVSKCTFSVQKLCYSQCKSKGSSKKHHHVIISIMPSENASHKFETSQILKIKINH